MIDATKSRSSDVVAQVVSVRWVGARRCLLLQLVD